MLETLRETVLGQTASAAEDAVELLEQLVGIESPSGYVDGTREVQEVLAQAFSTAGAETNWHEVDATSGRQLLQAVLPGNLLSRITLLGHVDTVYPLGTLAARPFRRSGTRLYGPGVSDMKGGLALMLSVVVGLSTLSREVRPDIQVLLTSDEEIGTPFSKPVIRRLLNQCDAVFNFEPGRPDGSVVRSRRGSAHLSLQVQGKAAHSGADFWSGSSAIATLASIVAALHALNDRQNEWTVNVGTMMGGAATNVVADAAEAGVHLAYSSEADGRSILEQARKLVEEERQPGTSAELLGDLSFLPMPDSAGTAGLFDLYTRNARLAGYEATAVHAMGASDAGIPASMGIPTLCGVGPIGGHWHSEDEYMDLMDFSLRAQAVGLTILDVASRHL